MREAEGQTLLSIVIPVFNRQESFNSLLSVLSNSIIAADVASLVEVIVVDDHSKTPVCIPAFPCSLFLERNQRNSGAPYSRERGYQLSKAKFIHFHDSDDSISENWLFEIIQELIDKPDIDILLTGRVDYEHSGKRHREQRFFQKKVQRPDIVLSRLIYWNCMGPMGGVTFSRDVLSTIEFKKLYSCQDWQMYLDAIKNAKVLSSRNDIQFLFHKTGDDRISHDARKKILGHLQLSRLTAKDSVFKRNIRLFYLYACKRHIFNQGGQILNFYKKKRVRIFMTYLVVSVYSFFPRL